MTKPWHHEWKDAAKQPIAHPEYNVIRIGMKVKDKGHQGAPIPKKDSK